MSACRSRKFNPVGIRAVRQNQRIIQCDVCDHLPACNFIADLFKPPRRLEVENLFPPSAQHCPEASPTTCPASGGDRALMVWTTIRWPSLLVQCATPPMTWRSPNFRNRRSLANCFHLSRESIVNVYSWMKRQRHFQVLRGTNAAPFVFPSGGRNIKERPYVA
jgi:hypothetical protein